LNETITLPIWLFFILLFTAILVDLNPENWTA